MPTPREAEVATEHFIKQRYTPFETWRAQRTRFARQDLFGADVVAYATRPEAGGSPLGSVWIMAQVTKGLMGCVRKRRRMLGAKRFPRGTLVLVLQLVTDETSKPYKHHFRVWEREGDPPGGVCWWEWHEQVEVPRAWFKTAGL